MPTKQWWLTLITEGSKKFGRRLLYFGDNSSLHGLRFVTEKNRSWFCRVFWVAALACCGAALLSLLRGAVRSAGDTPLSFTPDTARLAWQTAFPAVTVCEKYKYQATLHNLEAAYPDIMKGLKKNYDYKKMFADLCFGGTSCELCSKPCLQPVNCSVNFRTIANKIRKPCRSLIYNCEWMGRPIDCCRHFLPLDSDYGTCFSFNTLQSRLSGSVPIFKSNISTGPGYLSFFTYKDLTVYVHGKDDIPWLKSEADMQFEPQDSVNFIFRVVEMTNDPLVRDMDMDIRKCRFPNEVVPGKFGKSFKIYGYSTCIVDCETEIMYKRCQCVHHLRDVIYERKQCNFSGLGCLAKYAAERKVMPPEEADKLCKHCLPSCEQIELERVFFNEYEIEQDEDSDDYTQKIKISMVALPNIQYKRNVVRTKLDLVVSIGGLVGLFFGASLLSLVEAFYFFFIRNSIR